MHLISLHVRANKTKFLLSSPLSLSSPSEYKGSILKLNHYLSFLRPPLTVTFPSATSLWLWLRPLREPAGVVALI